MGCLGLGFILLLPIVDEKALGDGSLDSVVGEAVPLYDGIYKKLGPLFFCLGVGHFGAAASKFETQVFVRDLFLFADCPLS